MRRIFTLAIVILAVAATVTLSADDNADVTVGIVVAPEDEQPQLLVGIPPEAVGVGESASGAATVIERWWIDADHVDCVGLIEQTCLVVREGSEAADRTWFYDGIDGLDPVEGTAYVIDVAITPLEIVPADGPSAHYELVEILSAASASSFTRTA